MRRVFLIVAAVALYVVPDSGTWASGEVEDTQSTSVEVAALPLDWPQFRGPEGQGRATGGDLPLRWSERRNVVWRCRIPGRGWSSPVVNGDKIWVTSSENRGHLLKAVCISRTSGDIIRSIEVFRVRNPGKTHVKNSHATPTPILDGDRVFVHFGAHGTACISEDGEELWTRSVPYYHHHGPAASPVLHDGQLIFPCDGFSRPFHDRVKRTGIYSNQFIISLDADNGEVNWQTARDGRHAYATPLMIRVNGRKQLVCPGGDAVSAYDPETGEAIWSCRYKGYSVVPRPVVAGGLVYVCTGYDRPTLLAIRPTGEGDVTDSHVKWRLTKGVPLNTSPVVVGDSLYFISDLGIISCIDADNGTILWKKRLRGHFSASPVVANDRIYFLSENADTTVVAPGRTYEQLAVNALPGKALASMAVSGESLLIRTDQFLYRIADKSADTP